MSFLNKLFSYDELKERLTDKDAEIARLSAENAELRDRLFIKHSLPVSGAAVTTAKGTAAAGYAPKRTRLKDYINQLNPLVAPPMSLSEEEMKVLRDASQ